MKKKKLVLTLSGGMDSAVLLYMAVEQGFNDIHTVTFDYGQRHRRELECVQKQLSNFCEQYSGYSYVNTTNKILDVKYIKDIAPTSSLTNTNIDNPKISEMAGDAQPDDGLEVIESGAECVDLFFPTGLTFRLLFYRIGCHAILH